MIVADIFIFIASCHYINSERLINFNQVSECSFSKQQFKEIVKFILAQIFVQNIPTNHPLTKIQNKKNCLPLGAE